MKQIIIIADLAATFGGNFIESMKALQQADRIAIRYVLPQKAKGLKWIHDLTKVYYSDWSLQDIRNTWQQVQKEGKVDVVHFHFIGGRNGLKWRFVIGNSCRIVWHLHNHVTSGKGKVAWAKELLNLCLYHNSYKIGVSKSVSESVKKYSDEHIFTIYNAMYFHRLEQIGEDYLIQRLPQTINCMIMGNHFQRKGVDIAAKAVKQLNQNGQKAVLYIVLNDSIKPNIETFLKENLQMETYHSYIHFLPVRNDIATYYKKMDIFLSPSREEGWTWAIDEAAYCGCQVIASKIPGQDENQVPGFYWVGNPNEGDISNEMAKKIMDIYRMPESVKLDNIARAKEYMVKNFSMDQWVENILKVYNA